MKELLGNRLYLYSDPDLVITENRSKQMWDHLRGELRSRESRAADMFYCEPFIFVQ